MSEQPAPIMLFLGSPADREWADRIAKALERFNLRCEMRVASAHKTPDYLLRLLGERERAGGERVYITVAGRSNALSGFVDAQVAAPVIACPPSSDAFSGMDILSSLRMPRGVAPLVVLEPENAALAAAKVLGLSQPEVGKAVAASQRAERERVMGNA